MQRFRFDTSSSVKAKPSFLINHNIFPKLNTDTNSHVSFRRISISPMKESMNAFTFIVWVSLRLDIHFYFGSKIMNFRDIVNMVVARITSNLLKFIILRLSNSQPDHRIRDSLQHRNISDIQVNDRWRLVNRHLIRPSFQLMLVVEQINAGPRVCLKSRRIVGVIGVFLEPPRPSRRSILISLQLVPRILHTNLPCCHSPCLRHRRLNLKNQ